MKRAGLIAIAGMLLAPLAASAQTAPPQDIPSLTTQAPAGNASCFDYYLFGSVQAEIEPSLAQTVPGAAIAFSGELKNSNEYPIVDGTLYVKIFRKTADFDGKDGYPVIDEFALPDQYVLPAKGAVPAAFEWKVPKNLPSGDYFAGFFFATSGRYNLLGLSFTDDVVGNQAEFSVINSEETPVVGFDKAAVSLNDQPYAFASFPPHFGSDQPVVAKAKLVNPSDQEVTVPVSWKLYAWDALRKENLRSQKTDLVTLAPRETKEVSYTAVPFNSAVSYLIAETRSGETKSLLNIRFVRDGIEETRINFPGILHYPLRAGEENTLFACAHSTNLPVVSGNTLTLTLRDTDGNVVHSYRYDGNITGTMGGFIDKFTPDRSLANFSLTATLERNDQVFEEVTVNYDCNQIDPQACQAADSAQGGFFGNNLTRMAGAIIIVLFLIAIGSIAAILMRRRRFAPRSSDKSIK